MNEYLAKALHEYNMSRPASSPWLHKLDALPASVQSRIEERALEIELQDAMSVLEGWNA